MAITSLTLTNPGAEAGATTGWTSRSGGAPGVQNVGGAAHSGTWQFVATASGSTAKWDQQVAIPGGLTAAVDAGTCEVKGFAWHNGFASDLDSGALHLEAYAADGTTLLGSTVNVQSDPSVWTQETVFLILPALTRFVRFGTTNVRDSGTELSSYWDDFSLEISDNYTADYIPAAQVVSFGVEVLNNSSGSVQVCGFGVEILRSLTEVAPPSSDRRRPLYLA